jgi:hydrogenase nickel incorporation protein HypA/HybF
MHEFSIASGVVETVLEFAQARGLRKIVEVRMVIGELACVEAEQLKFCFQSITGETALENAALEIEPGDAIVRCGHCSYEGPPKYWDDAQVATFLPTLECPRCGRAAEAIAGHECSIKSIKYQRDSESPNPELSAA